MSRERLACNLCWSRQAGRLLPGRCGGEVGRDLGWFVLTSQAVLNRKAGGRGGRGELGSWLHGIDVPSFLPVLVDHRPRPRV